MTESGNRDHSSQQIFPCGTTIGKYNILSHIGKGGYGQIYSVVDNESRKQYALKYESSAGEARGLVMEEDVLQSVDHSKCFPQLISTGTFNGCKYMVIELLGASLSNVRRQLTGRHYSPSTALYLAFYTLSCVEDLHAHGFVHRDVKPGNFLLRPDWNNPICMIDFGLSARYIDKQTGRHIPNKSSVSFVGTCKYASMNSHEGHELSRRDDMISWFYSCVEFYAGHLPWPASRDKASTYEKKRITPQEALLKKLPPFFGQIYDYIFSLDFFATPDYGMIRSLLIVDLQNNMYRLDWELIDPEVLNQLTEIPLVSRKPRPRILPQPAKQATPASVIPDTERHSTLEQDSCCRV